MNKVGANIACSPLSLHTFFATCASESDSQASLKTHACEINTYMQLVDPLITTTTFCILHVRIIHTVASIDCDAFTFCKLDFSSAFSTTRLFNILQSLLLLRLKCIFLNLLAPFRVILYVEDNAMLRLRILLGALQWVDLALLLCLFLNNRSTAVEES